MSMDARIRGHDGNQRTRVAGSPPSRGRRLGVGGAPDAFAVALPVTTATAKATSMDARVRGHDGIRGRTTASGRRKLPSLRFAFPGRTVGRPRLRVGAIAPAQDVIAAVGQLHPAFNADLNHPYSGLPNRAHA